MPYYREVADALAPFGANETCWCGSEKKYKRCHGQDHRSVAGTDLPPDPEDGMYVAPNVIVRNDALKVPEGGAPIYMPPAGGPYTPPGDPVSSWAVTLAEAKVEDAPTSHDGVARMWFERLADYGLDDPATVGAQLGVLPDDVIHELRDLAILNARSTLDILQTSAAREEPPASLWAPQEIPERIIGRSLMWADHYLLPDEIAEAALTGPLVRESLSVQLARSLSLRPLIESGIAVPVATSVARVATIEAVEAELSEDLANRSLLDWTASQILVDGPSAREVIFVGPKDDYEVLPQMFFYGRIEPERGESDEENGRHFSTRMLNSYDPNHDYSPWIHQTRRQVAARYIRTIDENLAIAQAFGGHYVATAPFRGRLLARKQQYSSQTPHALANLRVPSLERLPPAGLAKILANEESVEAMRRAIRVAMRQVESGSGQGAFRLQELVNDLVDEANTTLRRSIRRSAVWSAAIPAGLSAATLLMGVPPLGAAVAAAAGLAPYVASRAEHRSRAAWMMLGARRS